MTTYQMVATTLIVAAIGLGLCVEQAAPAGADNPDPPGTESNPYRTFSCSCHEMAPPGSPALVDEIHRGMQEGRFAWLPGLPPPAA